MPQTDRHDDRASDRETRRQCLKQKERQGFRQIDVDDHAFANPSVPKFLIMCYMAENL